MAPWWWPLLWCLRVVLVSGIILTGGQQEGPPPPVRWSPSSSWALTPEPGTSGDPEGSAAALAFLQTGDAQRLAQANCSRGVAAGAAGPGPPPALRAALRAAPEALAQAANFLNMLFQTNDIREASVAEDVEWYQALVRSLAEGHPWVRRAVLALDAHPLAAKPRLMLQATKGDGDILLQDISNAAPGNLSWDNEWFSALRSQRSPPLRKRVLSNDLRSMDTPKWQRGDSYVGDAGNVRWSPPFLECRDGRFLPAWAVTLSSAFYGLKPDLSPEFKGVVRVDIELRDVAIDQCASGPGWFADTHRCDLNSTQCVPQESRGFVLGRYLCRCKPGFYGAGGVASGPRAGAAVADGGSRLACRPCRPGCVTCQDDAPCLIREDRALRAAVLSCQAGCMLAVFLSMLVSYHFRQSKRIRASGVVLLETILFGSLLLYFPVFILYFKPSIFRCIVLRWVRGLGFAIVYGTITLKLYRVLKVFLSRTAQRAPYVSSGRVLKMLGLILLLVLWFLAAWTAGMLENVDKNIPLVIRTQTARGLHFYICSHDRWDYMMVIAETLFLLWGSSLCYATRAVPSAFHEPRYMGIALHNELMISAAFHVVRFIMVPSLHPDWTLLLFFAHTHGTITMTLALLFIPKFLHAGSPLREEIAAEVYEDELDMRRSGSCLNSSITSAWSEHSLDPDDIREELKRLYQQLEVQTTRRMAANNPHLPKKRSSRRSLGRSILRRVTEPPAARRSSGGDTPTRRGSSAKRVPEPGGTSLRMRDEGSRPRGAALRKSRSTEGPAQDPWGGPAIPGEPTPGRTTMAMAAEPSDSESLDAVPLVCKSASAHNLGGHGQPPPPRAAPLHKSLSVVTGAREAALLAASRAGREGWHLNQHLSPLSLGHPVSRAPPEDSGEPQGPRAPPPAGSSPAEGSQEDTSPPGDGKVQKHVTYAPIKSISVDSSPVPGRVRVAVRRTPPPPPVRCQSLGQRVALSGDSPEPPTDPSARAGTPEGTAEDDAGRTAPLAGQSRLVPAAPTPAQVCPWELLQDEILSQKQKAAEAADLGTPGDTAAAPPSLKPPSQRTLRGLGLAIKALNRARGKEKREGGSRRERPPLAGTSAMSLGGVGRDPSAKSAEWSRQRRGSEPPARPAQGGTLPCQHNNNAGTAWAAAGWGDSGTAGQRDSLAPGTRHSEELAEEPGAPRVDTDAAGAPAGVHELPPSLGHQKGAECPHETPAVAAQTHPREGTEAPVVELGTDAPAAIERPAAPKDAVAEGLEGDSGSIPPRDHSDVEQPHASRAEVCPWEGDRTVRAQICPWDTEPEQPGKGLPPNPPDLPKTPPEQAGTSHRKKADVCPWEAEDELLARAEICPWEEPAAPAGKARASQDTGGMSRGENKPGGGELEGIKAKLAEMSGHRPERRDTRVFAKLVRRLTEGSKAEFRASQSMESIKEEVCPWEGPGTERPPEKPHAGGSVLPASPAQQPQSVGSLKAEICPWEAPGVEITNKAEICPWEAAAPPASEEKPREDKGAVSMESRSPSTSQGLCKEIGDSTSGEKGKASGERESVCPWESADVEQPPKKPRTGGSELPKPLTKQPQSVETLKSEICPWEAPELKPTHKAEICPWEAAAPPSNTEKSREDKGAVSMESRSPSTSQGLCKEIGDSTSGEKGKASGERESVCPWESADVEQPPKKPRTGGSELPKPLTKQPQSVETLKSEICPWEAPELKPTHKAEICPWEAAAPPSNTEKSREDKGAVSMESRSPSTSQGLCKEIGDSTSGEKGKASGERESVCPWESADVEQPPKKPHAGGSELPTSLAKQPQSVGSLKSEICPWEAPGVEITNKAEICPWEAAAPPASEAESRQDKDGLSGVSRSPSINQGVCKEPGDSTAAKKEKASGARESVCPWERADTDGASVGSGTKSSELPKAKKWESVGGARAEVCPWEGLGTEQPPEKPHAGGSVLPASSAQQPQSTESLKSEICPWEAPGVESTDKAEICPWEAAAPPSHPQKAEQGPGVAPRGDKRIRRQAAFASPARSLETGGSEREAVCPWEGLGTQQLPEKPRTGGSALPKPLTKQPQSTESLKSEICPWEAPELKPTHKAEICPWEAAAPPSSKEKPREDKGAVSMESRSPSTSQGLCKEIGDSTSGKKGKGSGERESVCPWESADVEQPPKKPRAGGSELPTSLAKQPQSVGSLKSEICPWEAPGVESVDKAEICPWEAAVGKGAAPGTVGVPPKPASASKPAEQGSSERESVCPWESLGTEEPSPKPVMGKEPPDSAGSRKSDICPWEAAEAPSSESCKPALHARGAGRASPMGMGTAKLAAGASAVSPTAPQKESGGRCGGEAQHKPLRRVPGIQPPQGSGSRGTSVAEVCPWEAEEAPAAPAETSTEPRKTSDVCPWEVGSAETPPAGTSPGDGSRGVSETKPEVCPWDHE